MSDSVPYQSLSCKACSKVLMELNEILTLFEYIRNHDSAHFGIDSITRLVDHFSEECPVFSKDTNHDEAQRLVRFSVSNLEDQTSRQFSIFDIDKEILDYIQHELRK